MLKQMTMVLSQLQAFSLLSWTALFFVAVTPAPAGDRSVTAGEVNGTYRRGNSEIKILALGRGKLKVQLALVYEYDSPAGRTANMGDASGEATIENDVAIFIP